MESSGGSADARPACQRPFFLASGTLAAECPDPSCGIRLPKRFGLAAETVIPIVGAGNVGKTQLMYRLYQDLCELIPAYGGTITLEGDSKDRLEDIGQKLADTNAPAKTSPTTSPRLMYCT